MGGAKSKILTSKENKIDIIPNFQSGGVETRLTFTENYLGKVQRLGGFPILPNTLGLGGTLGVGFMGLSASTKHSFSTGDTILRIKFSVGGLGYEKVIVFDKNFNVKTNSDDLGVKFIAGAKGEVIGIFSLGVKGEADLGIQFKDGQAKINADGSASAGLIFGDVDAEVEIETLDRGESLDTNSGRCFAAGTLVDMADGTRKPIERIRLGDEVMAYDPAADGGRGGLKPAKVTQTHATPDRIVLNFHGTKVTPGHVFLCGDGPYEGQHRMLIDILRDDGALVRDDGTLVRAATNCPGGSPGDRLINVLYRSDANQPLHKGRLRAGARLPDSKRDMTVMEIMAEQGYVLLPDGNIVRDGEAPHPLAYWGELPKPEDYVLRRSGVTLDELYNEDVTLQTDSGLGLPGLPIAHEAPATVVRPDGLQAHRVPNRAERRRQKAIQRKRSGETIH